MHHVPKPQNKKPQMITTVSVAVGIAVFLLAPILPAGQAIAQAAAFVLFGVGLYFAIRYLFTSFSYAVEEGDFTVQKSQGRRVGSAEARLALDELAYFAPLQHGKISKDVRAKYSTMQIYNYTVTYRPDGAYLAVFVDAADNAIGVIIEPSGEMVTLFGESK